jgi:hypothetical protein
VKFLIQYFRISFASADPDPSSCLGPLHDAFDDIFGAFASDARIGPRRPVVLSVARALTEVVDST